MSLNTLLSLPSFPNKCAQITDTKSGFVPKLVSLAVAVTLNLNSPLCSLAIPSLNNQLPVPSPTTPFSESKNLEIGLEKGKIRPCPSTNPGCITTNPKSSSFTFPLTITDNDPMKAVQRLKEAILKTQKNAKIQVLEDTKDGQYLQAEVDGGLGRDVMEVLVKGDVAVYRIMAKNVTFVYPFTTALGDSKGQEERLKMIVDELGWYAPSFDDSVE